MAVICLLAPRLWAAGCGATTTTPTTAVTSEQILSEFEPMLEFLLFSEIRMMDNFYLGDVASQIDFIGADIPEIPLSGKKGPAAICDLPDTSKKASTVSDIEPVVGHLQPFMLESGPVSPTADEAWKRWSKARGDEMGKLIELGHAEEKAEDAARRLGYALNNAMNTEPGSEEARRAGRRVSEAAEEAKETAKEADEAKQEYEKATEEAEKASKEYREATDKAYEEAEKQNEAAGEAAEKAYEATGHGTGKATKE